MAELYAARRHLRLEWEKNDSYYLEKVFNVAKDLTDALVMRSYCQIIEVL